MESVQVRPAPDAGRPAEIEEPSNRYFVHPLARLLVDRLVSTPVTPNQVSVTSVFTAAAAAACYLAIPAPFGALAALPLMIAWHVLDGADGNLARRTGRASANGELVDGICDHLSQILIYLAFAFILQRSLGGWAWVIAAAAGLSHFLQSNAYENGRKTYRRWVYAAPWMRQSLDQLSDAGRVQGLVSRFYVGLSALSDGGEAAVEVAMTPVLAGGEPRLAAARANYRDIKAPEVRASGVLGANARTLAAFLSMLAGSPLWYFLFEIVVLNLALAVLIVARRKSNRAFVASLTSA